MLDTGERYEILAPRLDANASALPEGSTELEVLDGHGPGPEDVVTTFRTTYLDIDEVSRYSLSLSCSGTCAPHARPTRHPIYFAHGFNSSAKVWQPFLARLQEQDPAWKGWIDAQDVPGYDPVEV